MSWFSKLLPNPIDVITAPFEKRDGMPWAQSTARNLGHASFGDTIGNYVDQHALGDSPDGQWKYGLGGASTPTMAPPPETASAAPMGAQQATQTDPSQKAKLLLAWINNQSQS